MSSVKERAEEWIRLYDDEMEPLLRRLLRDAIADIERLEEENGRQVAIGDEAVFANLQYERKRATRYRSALERIRDGDWNWPKTARDIATEALEEEKDD